MAWQFKSGISLSTQIVNKLRLDILGGVYPPGCDFPTVRELAATASVNPNTMQKALAILEEEGLLLTKGTVGRSVTCDEEALARARERVLEEFIRGVTRDAQHLNIEKDNFIELIEKGWQIDG